MVRQLWDVHIGYLLLSGTRYGGRRVTVGEDEQSGRVRRHDDDERGPSRNRRLPGVGPVVTVTVASRGDPLAQM
jgi:hypothetical protein